MELLGALGSSDLGAARRTMMSRSSAGLQRSGGGGRAMPKDPSAQLRSRCGFPKNEGPILGAPVLRIRSFGVYGWGWHGAL